jgi:hypothetical protein
LLFLVYGVTGDPLHQREFALLPVVAQLGFERGVGSACFNSVTRNKIPLASRAKQGFMSGNNKPKLDAMRAGHLGNEEA